MVTFVYFWEISSTCILKAVTLVNLLLLCSASQVENYNQITIVQLKKCYRD
jgi:hypothetical protein